MDAAQYLQATQDFDPSDKLAFRTFVLHGRRRLTRQTLRQLASELRTAPGTLSRWEAGVCAPPPVARLAIVNHLRDQVR